MQTEHANQSTSAAAALATVEGVGITHATLASALDGIIASARERQSFSVFTLNLDHVVKLRRDSRFRKAYAGARIVTADGAPIAWLARRQNPAVKRATGADLAVPLAQRAADAGLGVFLFGTSPSALSTAVQHLKQCTDGRLDIVGTLSPSLAFDPEGAEADAAIEHIALSGAQLTYLALGAPKQELFAERARSRGVKSGFVCIGAALDFLAGTQVRAPRFFRENGIEWLWRLGANPKRMARRYADCAGAFSSLAIADLTSRRTTPRP